MEKKYTALRIIATGMKILGVLVGIVTVISACVLIVTGFSLGVEFARLTSSIEQGPSGWGSLTGLVTSILASILPVIIGGSITVLLYGGGEAIYVQLDIEANTRKIELSTHNTEANIRSLVDLMSQSRQLPTSTAASLSSTQPNKVIRESTPPANN